MPDPPASRKAALSTLEPASFGSPAFDAAQEVPEPSIPPYADIARPASLKGTGGMDPIAQQIVAGLKPSLDDLKQEIRQNSGPRGYERLAESFASIVERAIQPVANTTPSQPLPALVAPDPRVETLESRVSTLESTLTQLVGQLGTLIQTQQDQGKALLTLTQTQAQILELLRKGDPAPTPTPPIDIEPQDEGEGEGNGEGGGGTPAPLDNTPTSAPLGPPTVPPIEGRPMPPIKPVLPFKLNLPLDDVITADLESLQGKGGAQTPFMVEWYGRTTGTRGINVGN